MLYKRITYMYIVVFYFIGLHTVDGAYINPNVTTSKMNVTCGSGASAADTCEINCDLNNTQIPNIQCGIVGHCIINCANERCLRNTNIYATNALSFEFTSTGKSCVEGANIYLPNNGNATIIADPQGINVEVLSHLSIHSGTQTDHIRVECNGVSAGNKKECYAIQIDAKTAKHLEIVINGAEFSGHETKTDEAAIIECPVNSTLSPSCIINANNAFSTRYLHIKADKGIPRDVVFYSNGVGDYTGTTIECSAGISTINDNSFVGTLCYDTILTISTLTTTTTTSPMTKYWICDENCEENDTDNNKIEIKVTYSFSPTIQYNLANMECFLYQIFVNASYDEFNFCDIDIFITDIYGGIPNEDDIFCADGPCFHANASYDANTTMIITTYDLDAYNIISGVSMSAMMAEFETAFMHNFGVDMNVKIFVVNIDDRDSVNIDVNPLYYMIVIVGGILLLCCIIFLLIYFCCRFGRRRTNKKISISDGYNDNATQTQHKPRKQNSTDSGNWDQGKGPISFENVNDADLGVTSLSNDENIVPLSIATVETIEMITYNKLYTDGLRKSRPNYMSSDDEQPPIPLHEDWNTQMYANDDWKTCINANVDLMQMCAFNTYLNAMNQYQENVYMQNNMNYQPELRQSIGIKSIQPKIVNKLTKQYNKKDKKDKKKYKTQRKQSERIEDEISVSSARSNDNAGNDNEDVLELDDAINNKADDDDDNVLLNDVMNNKDGDDVLTNMTGLLSFQHIDCASVDDKRATGSVILHRD